MRVYKTMKFKETSQQRNLPSIVLFGGFFRFLFYRQTFDNISREGMEED